jgi:hypothetical protein
MCALGEETSPLRTVVGWPEEAQPAAPGEPAGGLECEQYDSLGRQANPDTAPSRDAVARRGLSRRWQYVTRWQECQGSTDKEPYDRSPLVSYTICLAWSHEL